MQTILVNAINMRSGGTRACIAAIFNQVSNSENKFVLIADGELCELAPPSVHSIQVRLFSSQLINLVVYAYVFVLLTPFYASRYNANVIFYPGGFGFGFGRKVVLSFHNIIPVLDNLKKLNLTGLSSLRIRFLRMLYAHFYKRAAGVIFVSSYGRDSFFDAFGPCSGLVTVVENGVNPEFRECNKASIKPGGVINVVWLSDINIYKPFDVFLDALTELCARGVNIRVDVLGKFNDQSGVKHLAKLRSLVDNGTLRMHGFCNSFQIKNKLEKAHVAVFLSYAEMCPVSLLELLSSGIPVIVNDQRPLVDYQKKRDLIANIEREGNLAQVIMSSCRKASKSSVTPAFNEWATSGRESVAFLGRVALE